MTTLIASLSTGKGTWGHVSRLIDQADWKKIILITNDFGREKYSNDKEFELIVIENNKPAEELALDIKNALEGKIEGEVAVNFVSGAGNEHMAIMSALMHLGIGFRLVVAGEGAFKEL